MIGSKQTSQCNQCGQEAENGFSKRPFGWFNRDVDGTEIVLCSVVCVTEYQKQRPREEYVIMYGSNR